MKKNTSDENTSFESSYVLASSVLMFFSSRQNLASPIQHQNGVLEVRG